MKYKWLAPATLLSGILIFLLFKLFEGTVISFLTPLFPSSDEHPAGYYADMIRLVFTELTWIIISIALFLYWYSSNKFIVIFTTIENALLRNSSLTVSIILSAYFFVTLFISVFALKTFANSADEYAYLFQAEDLGQGKLWSDVHPHSDFFDFHHIVQKEGKWISRFPPGWPLLLSVAFVLSIPPFLVNVILGLVTLWVFYLLVRKLYNVRIAIWALLTVAAASFYIFNAASYFSHTSSMLHVVSAMYLTLLYFEKEKFWTALLAGLFVGLLALTRPYTAVLIFGPFYLSLLIQYKWRAVVPFLLVGAGALPSMIYLFWYNQMTTGNPAIPVTMWAYADEKLGFTRDHTPIKGLKHIFKRLMMFIYWASPQFLILYIFFLWSRMKDFKKILKHPEDYFFLILIAGYFLYYEYGGNQYGPRFYFEGFPFLITFILIKVFRQEVWWGRALFFTGLLFCMLKIPFIALREHKVIQERLDLYNKVADAGLQNAVVFISSPTGIIRPMDEANLNRNDKAYSNSILYALDKGQDNKMLMEYYTGRSFYRYIRDENEVEGNIIPITESQDFTQN